MKHVKVAGASLNQTPLAWENNKKNILESIERARRQGVSILCLSELCITGYGCEDAFHAPGVIDTAWEKLEEILPHTKGMIVSIGLPVAHQNALFNVACLAVNGKILGFAAKQHLAGDGIHYEPRWFKAWPQGLKSELKMKGKSYPIGDVYFDVSGIKIGFEICEDAWVARRPGSDLSLKGIDIILNPSASHFAFGKFEVRKRFVLEGSRAFGVSYVYSNLLGCESGRAIFDGGVLIASGGKLLKQGKRFSFSDVVVETAVIDVSLTRMSQTRTASFSPNLETSKSSYVSAKFNFPETAPSQEKTPTDSWESSEELKKEEFSRSVSLGLFDYLRKTKSQGFVVSLSGGADSAAVSCLVRLMAELGIEELGIRDFIGKLTHLKKISLVRNVDEVCRQILTCVYQKTKNSSNVTQNAAQKLAKAIGAEFMIFDVGPLVEKYVGMVSDSMGRKLNWKSDDLSLQNIQARVRAPGVWLVANVKNSLLLVTSNRSEAAVGYATMDGDTCGGLCPIGGIDKNFLRQWLIWLERKGPSGKLSIPALSLVNDQTPTAELRPKENNQTDEADLMPYDVLDFIERASIRDKKMPIEIFESLKAEYGKRHSDAEFLLWVERFFVLWCRNQWKRERYAPSFHLDDENLDPKTWCRFPILSGNFASELDALKKLSTKK